MILCCLISFVLLALSTSVVSGRQQTCLSHVPPAAFAAQRSTENDERSFFKNPFASAPPKPELTTEETTKMVLDELGIEAMEPRVFYTDPDRFVDVATAFMPVSGDSREAEWGNLSSLVHVVDPSAARHP